MKSISKISVTFFINKNVKPFWTPYTGDTDRYPLYVQVTFRRRNTQFRSLNKDYYKDIEEAYYIDRSKLDHEEYIIKQVVEYELKNKRERFQLKGLKTKYSSYTRDLIHAIDIYLRAILKESLEKSDSKYKGMLDPMNGGEPTQIYLDASMILIKDFKKLLPDDFMKEMKVGEEFILWCKKRANYPKLIEWLNEPLKNEYINHLNSCGYSKEQIGDTVGFINKSIESIKMSHYY